MTMNSNVNTPGRFGNQFFRNVIASHLAKNNNLKFTYSDIGLLKQLGILLYETGTETYNVTQNVYNSNFMELMLGNTNTNTNFDLSFDYFQTKESALYIRNCMNEPIQKDNIISNNPYKTRYNNNNDVYIHIRLGDVSHFAQSFEYFDNILSNLTFETGYISTDSIDNSICKLLIDKYNLNIITNTEIETIQFASTCKNIILSTGTFSWVIGILSFYSTIYYPKIKHIWHGDIFIFPDWIEKNW